MHESLSSEFPGGDLGGISGADNYCQSEANFYNVEGTYRAWLAANSAGPADSWTIADFSNAAFLRMDGQLIARSWADLTDGSIANRGGPRNLDSAISGFST